MFDLVSWFNHPDAPLVISGPCSVESEVQLMETAKGLSEIPEVKVLRGGIWKPRTRPQAFEGMGEVGLDWLRKAKKETGLLTATEIAMPQHVELALKYDVDVLWVGARTVVNPFSVQQLADALSGTNVPLFVKNPVSPDVQLWLGAVERFRKAGIEHLAGIHRGFQYYRETAYRNLPMWEIPIAFARLANVPVITDVSHICGNRELLLPTAQKAVDLATDGLMLECHYRPDEALTDARQQITPRQLRELLDALVMRAKNDPSAVSGLMTLRGELDYIDDELLQLLTRRMNVSTQIGQYKKTHNMTIVQMDRWKKTLADHLAMARKLDLDPDMVAAVFESIHQASIRKQTDVLNDINEGKSL